ncbi:DUF294 nucleotidyltransferase-like domain-containing protein [Deferribacter thermophilus]|uniref:putative nucleotidyltransferase substrate binding domain-containing protein n=1 Tax=Deferribacter thermophilus TaxID=53573 RepID=UPI003C21E1B3
MANALEKLKKVKPFDNLPEEAFKLIKERSKVKIFSPGTIVFSQYDEPTGYLYFIAKGEVEIITETDEGVEITVDKRGEGDFFGWTPIFSDSGYTAGARTATEVEALLIPKDVILKISGKFPEVARYFSKSVFSRIKKLYNEVVKTHVVDPIAQVEAYPFQKKLKEIMSYPVERCKPDTTVSEIARIMTLKGIGSVLVCDDEDNLLGIITERDLVTKVLAREVGVCLRDTKACEIMTPNPYVMSPESYMYEAAAFMISHGIRHLPVVENGKLLGIVTVRDLLRFRSQKTVLLVGRAKEAKALEELKQIKNELVFVAKVLLMENRSQLETMEILSYIHHVIIQRTFEIVKDEMTEKGYKFPDIRFAFLIMGSGGRKEMLLGPDQDNGFIFEDYPDEMEEEIKAYFSIFSERLVNALEFVGYPKCHGNVMVTNPLWTGRYKEWEKRVSKWIEVPEPQWVRYSTIFFDFVPLLGDGELCNKLRDFIFKKIKENMIFLYQLMELDYKHKVPIGVLGRFITSNEPDKKGKLSVKENGSIFIVDCIRMYALEHSIHNTNTVERMEKLLEKKVFNDVTVENLRAALEFFTYLRLKNEIELIEKGKKPSHYLDPYSLSKDEQEALKEAFKVADKLQDTAKRHFARIVGL